MDKDAVIKALESLSTEERRDILRTMRQHIEAEEEAKSNYCLNRLSNPEKFDALYGHKNHFSEINSPEELREEVESVPVFSDFVVVEYSGQDNEKVVKSGYCDSFKAQSYIDRNYSKSEMKTLKPSVMKRFSDGSLTTEF